MARSKNEKINFIFDLSSNEVVQRLFEKVQNRLSLSFCVTNPGGGKIVTFKADFMF